MNRDVLSSSAGLEAQASTARVFIKGLMVDAEIGVWHHEKGRRQILRIDVEFTIDDPRAAGDDHAKVVCYADVAAQVQAVIDGGHFNLVEWLAESIADRLLEDRRIQAVRLRVEKPGAIRNAEAAGWKSCAFKLRGNYIAHGQCHLATGQKFCAQAGSGLNDI